MSWQGNSNSFSRCTKDSSILITQPLEKSEQDGRAKDKKIADLQTENTSKGSNCSLTAQMDQIKAELWDKINNLTDKLKGGLRKPYECR